MLTHCAVLLRDSHPHNPLTPVVATGPRNHLLSPIIATLPKTRFVTPLLATHPAPPGGMASLPVALARARSLCHNAVVREPPESAVANPPL
jgi:hypothetical protein